MKYVVDASFVASLFLPDESQDASDRLAAKIKQAGATAPALLQLEIANILLMARRRKRITSAQITQLLQALEHFPIVSQPVLSARHTVNMMHLADKHALSAYDAAYLELAVRLTLPLATHDKQLAKAARAEGVTLSI
jgi:predicted nucleic acid-binding protein